MSINKRNHVEISLAHFFHNLSRMHPWTPLELCDFGTFEDGCWVFVLCFCDQIRVEPSWEKSSRSDLCSGIQCLTRWWHSFWLIILLASYLPGFLTRKLFSLLNLQAFGTEGPPTHHYLAPIKIQLVSGFRMNLQCPFHPMDDNLLLLWFSDACNAFDLASGNPVKQIFVPFNISIFLLELVLLFGTTRYYLHLVSSEFQFSIQLFV